MTGKRQRTFYIFLVSWFTAPSSRAIFNTKNVSSLQNLDRNYSETKNSFLRFF